MKMWMVEAPSQEILSYFQFLMSYFGFDFGFNLICMRCVRTCLSIYSNAKLFLTITDLEIGFKNPFGKADIQMDFLQPIYFSIECILHMNRLKWDEFHIRTN